MDPTPQTATASGTITGWDTDARLVPAVGHYTIALVTYSHTDDFDDPANDLVQPTDGMGNDLNVCGRFAAGPAVCNWQMNVRTGGQIHYAIIMDGDTNGTPMNFDDDVWTFKAYAIKTGINLSSGQASTGEALALLADADVQTLTVTFPAVTPTGLGNVMAMPILDAGAEGWLLLPLPALSPASTTARVPRLTGALASGSYKLLARAQTTAPMADVPNTNVFMQDVNISGTVQITDWLPTATGLSATSGTYSFGAVSGANLHAVDFRDATGKKAWAVALLDGSTSFTLPALTPDGLPAGMVDMEVNAIDVTGFSASDFMLDNLFDILNRMSANTLRFTH